MPGPPGAPVTEVLSLLQFAAAPRSAKEGGEVALDFVSTKALSEISARFAGRDMNCGSSALSHRCTITITPEFPAGRQSFSVEARDLAGTRSALYTPDVPVDVDFTAPSLTASISPNPANRGEPVTFLLGGDEPLATDPAPSIEAAFLASPVSCFGTGRTFTCAGGTIHPATPRGVHAFRARGRDLAGHESTVESSVLVEDADQLPPAFTNFRVTPARARAGAVVTLAFDSTEPLPPDARGARPNPEVTLDGEPMDCARSSLSYVCEAMVTSAPGPGGKLFELIGVDAGENETRLVPPVGVVFDFAPPSLGVSASPEPAVKDQPVTFIVTADEELDPVSPPLVDAPFLAGPAPCTGVGALFRCTGVVSAGAARGPQRYEVWATDLAGNGARVEGSLVLRESDQTPPAFSNFRLERPVVRAGASVVLSFDSTEPLPPGALAPHNPEVTVGGLPMTCTSMNLAHRCVVTVPVALGEGSRPFRVRAADAAGNEADVVPPIAVVLDFSAPAIAAFATPSPALRGQPVNFGVSASEDLDPLDPPVITGVFLASPPTCAGAGRTFNCTGGLVAVDAPVGIHTFVAAARDPAGNVGMLSVDVEVQAPVEPPPRVAFNWIRPPLAADGTDVTLEFSADRAIDECGAVVGGQVAFCSIVAASRCRCVLSVTPSIPEGNDAVTVSVTSGGAVGQALGALLVDRTGARARGDRLFLVRRPVGQNDAVQGLEGCADDNGRLLYPTRGVQLLRFFTSPDAAAPVLQLGSNGGAFAPVELANTDGASLSRLAPARLWASAVDLAGNEGARVELSGADVTPPAAPDGTLATWLWEPAGSVHALSAAAGFAFDAGSFARAVAARVYLSEAAAAPALTLVPAADGSLALTAAGTRPPEDGRTVYVSLVDKAGNEGARGQVSNVRRRLTLAGREEGQAASSPASMYPRSAGGDPRLNDLENPDLRGAEASSAESAAASGVDALRVAVSAAPDASSDHLVWSCPLPATWSARPAAGRMMAYDSHRRRTVYLTTKGAVYEWNGRRWFGPFQPANNPGERGAAALAYDSARRRVVLFGGESTSSSRLDDTWEWDGSSWTGPLLPLGRPAPRRNHAMAYDSERGRTVLFGGYELSGYRDLDDVWEWDGAAWTGPLTPGNRPGRRSEHAMAYDSARGRVVVFGGDQRGVRLDDLWEWNGTTWTGPLTPALRPTGRAGASAAFDGARSRVLVYGGNEASRPPSDELWEWDGTAWRGPLAPATRPAAQLSSGLVFDAAEGRAHLFLPDGAVWAWESGDWTRIDTRLRPGFRSGASLAYDAARQRTVLFGGAEEGALRDDVWEWDGARWSGPHAPASRPSARQQHGLAYDAFRQRTILFGGRTFSQLHDDLWEWDGAAWAGPIRPPLRPTGRAEHAFTYDAGRRRLVLFGGSASVADGERRERDLWEYDGTSWTAVAAVGPAARSGAVAAYDSARARTVLFGGRADQGLSGLDELWEWDGLAWARHLPSLHPLGRVGHALSYDPVRRATLLFGGLDLTYWPQGAVVEWNGSAWSGGPLPAPRPGGRELAYSAYDAARGTHVMFGVNYYPAASPDPLWEYRFAQPGARTASTAFSYELPTWPEPETLSMRWVGAGRGASGDGVTLWAWRAATDTWVPVGANAATDGESETARTIASVLPGPGADYLTPTGRVWLLAAAPPSAQPPATTPSELFIDYLELEATYALP